MSEIFNGRQVEELIKLLKTAARELQTLHTDPIFASVNGEHQGNDVRLYILSSPLAMRMVRRLGAYFSIVKGLSSLKFAVGGG